VLRCRLISGEAERELGQQQTALKLASGTGFRPEVWSTDVSEEKGTGSARWVGGVTLGAP
jgi:hypothetical protein